MAVTVADKLEAAERHITRAHEATMRGEATPSVAQDLALGCAYLLDAIKAQPAEIIEQVRMASYAEGGGA